jgi:hypothetical protein
MDAFLHWAGFFGAWLLVAGPLFQASIELRDEAIDRDEFAATMASVPPARHTSAWWWLLPPVAYLLRRRRSKAARDAVLLAMTPTQRAQFIGFQNKAYGWFAVAGGAFLIALKETGELVELYELPPVVFWVTVVGLTVAVLVGNGLTSARSDAVLHIDDPDYAAKRRAERERMNAERRAQGAGRRAPKD